MNLSTKFIKIHKDSVTTDQQRNVIYKILCEFSYVGQTKRQLGTRAKEHKNYVRLLNKNSVLTNHSIENNHSIDWDSTEILDTELNYIKRLTSELLHIKLQHHSLNKM